MTEGDKDDAICQFYICWEGKSHGGGWVVGTPNGFNLENIDALGMRAEWCRIYDYDSKKIKIDGEECKGKCLQADWCLRPCIGDPSSTDDSCINQVCKKDAA